MLKLSNLESFYASKVWRDFRLTIIAESGLTCDVCKKLITGVSEAHVHHTEELTEENFRDAMISLNPKKMMVVHRGCHNKLHNRFGAEKRVKRVFIVYGMPCSGKTTFVEERKEDFDIVLDMDKLFQAITLLPPYEKPNSLLPVVKGVYNQLLDNVKTRTGKWRTAWVIGGFADKYQRDKLASDLGAEMVLMECTKEEAITRLKQCPYRKKMVDDYTGYINKWVERYVE